MNGIHDLGGMHGFGAIDTDEDDEVFHDHWEALAFAMQVVTIHGEELYNLHEFRRAREEVDSGEYLTSAYYDNWLAAVEKLAIEKGVITAAELEERVIEMQDDEGDLSIPERTDPDLTEATLDRIQAGVDLKEDGTPRFDAGDEVVVRSLHPEGHTRCPGYIRRCRGVIDSVYGVFPLPDALGHGQKRAEPLYSVRFDAAEVWDDYTDATNLHVDMWESYLKPATAE